MPREKDIKKSKFYGVSSFVAGDYVDLVRNGQNFKIAYTDFIASLGVSGLLQSVGEVSAIPVYFLDGSVHNFRSILGGSGIVASLSPGNAVKVSHNFTVDKTGAPVLANETADSPTIRSIVGGTGITVAASGNVLQISESGSPGSTKTVFVYQESDLPTAVGGVITLADDTEYYFLNDVTTANRFVVGEDTVITGSDGSLITLTYTGAATMFTSSDKSWKMKDIILVAASGTLFNVASSTGLHIFRYFNGSLTCNNAGNFDNMQIVYLFNIIGAISTQGFTFTNNFVVALFDTVSISIPSGTGTAFDLGTATFDSIALSKMLFNVNSTGYCLTGAAASANINSGGLGSVFNCQQLGTADFLNGNVSPYDDLWEMFLNSDIINSLDLALVTHNGATIAITTINTPVVIGATWTSQDMHRFTHAASGRWTYVGKGTHVEIDASISGASSAVSDTFKFYLYKNGVQIAASGVSRTFTTSVGSLSLLWETELETNDYLELWVENTTGTYDFVVSALTLRIKS